ncbi:MAG: hypothetical protein PHI35_02525 [Victivallaceae bacterium]|nr:hypothetical protein [Victivallaceae bacterium]
MISERRSKIIIGLEAAFIALAVHALLVFLTDYREESAPRTENTRAGVMLFDPGRLTPDERSKFDIWFEVNDPAQFSRSDGKRGFLAGRAEPELRDYTDRRPRPKSPAPAAPAHQAVMPLRELAAAPRLPDEFNAITGVRAPSFSPAVVRILDGRWRDAEGVVVETPLRSNKKSTGPSVISVTPVGDTRASRITLREACGDHERDLAALTAIYRARRSGRLEDGVFYVFWPEPEAGL